MLSLHPQQWKAYNTRANEILYGGAAGGGKSHLLRVAAILFCSQIPGLQCYLFRRLYPDLIGNHMEGPTGFPMLLADAVNNGFARITASQIIFANGSKIYLRHCQYEKNVYSYAGREIHLLLIDELTHWSESMYRFLRGRCRLGGFKLPPQFEGMFPRIICGTNPGQIGHHWVKRSFVEPFGPEEGVFLNPWKTPIDEGAMVRRFIPARIADNPTLLENDPTYTEKLHGLGDPLLVRAMLSGDWDIVPGAMFGDVWRKEYNGRPWHVVKPFPIPMGWEVWRGADDGFGSPAACYWITRNPDHGRFIVLRELYKAGMTPAEFADLVRDGDQRIEFEGGGRVIHNTHSLTGIMDSAAFSHTGASLKSRGEQMNDMGTQWKPCEKWPGSRIQRIQDFHRLLRVNPRDIDRLPAIQFFHTCANAIRTIPTLPRDPQDAEDVMDNAEDHAFDAVSYGLQKKIFRRKGPLKVTGV